MISLIIIAVCAVVITAIIAYERGFSNGFKAARSIFNKVFDNSLLRLGKDAMTDPTNTDEQE